MDKFGATLEGNVYFIYVNVVFILNPEHIISIYFPHIHEYCFETIKFYSFQASAVLFSLSEQNYVYNSLNSAHLGFH